ncbi:MAG: insulinase family protein [FCB group bacterium]|nr:insulinase family protein [FCB group bacterium]
MCKSRLISIFISFLIVSFLSIALVSDISAKTTRVTFGNGMEVIFKENHSSPMITSIVFVRAGAKYENDFNNGITHFLEHLLFDGTKNRSRQEITAGIKNHGGYINAFTRKDLTGYLVLMPKEFIDFGIDVQADQLFNSIFPDEELEKERKVVIEEIQMDNDREANLAEYFFSAKSMAGTAYERPVLGYKNIIASIPKHQIVDYWKRYYAPNNMIALVIGDFETDEMIEKYRSVFGIVPPVSMPSAPDVSYFPPQERTVFKKAGQTKTTYIQIGIDAPHYTDPDYFAFDLLADYLNSDENSPLKKILVGDSGVSLCRSFSAYMETAEEFSRLIIEVQTDDEKKVDPIIAGVEEALENFADYQPDVEILQGIKVSKKADEIFLQEKLHYYGFMVAPKLVATGWEFMESYLGAIDQVNSSMLVRATDRWFAELNYTATVFYPRKETETAETPQTHTVYKKEILANGLTVVVKSNLDSRVFALNVIGKNRSASEPIGKTGITDFVNRTIKKGTTTYPAEELSRKLAAIGAKVTVGDLPWISHDDFYTTRRYAFMKFETIDEFTREGLDLFADMIKNPAFAPGDVESVRGMLMGVLGRQSGSTLDVCRNQFYATLFEGQPYEKSINGSPRGLGMITRDDLVTYHKKFYSPGNMIITIGTNYDAEMMMAMAKDAFGSIPAVEITALPVKLGPHPVGVKTVHQDMDKEQVYIFLGNRLPGIADPDAPAISLAAQVLSGRLKQVLREEQGLAYSVGSGATFDRNFGWFTCTMGTGAANYVQARDGILAEIEKLKTDGPTTEELETAKNSQWGRTLTRRLSRINQAYYMGVNEYLGVGYDYEKRYLPKMRALTVDQVKNAAAKYFDTQNYILSTAGKM